MLNPIETFSEAVWHVTAPATSKRGSPNASQAQWTFIQGMLEMPSRQGRRNPAEWAASLLFHIVIVAAVIVTPLFFTRTIDLSRMEETFLVAPLPPPAAPAPARVEKVLKAVARPLPQPVISQPVMIPAKIRIVHDAAPPPEPGTLGVVGGIGSGEPGGVLGGIIGGTSRVAVPPPPARRTQEIYRIGGDVKPPQVIYAPPPAYPVLARTSRVQGTVTLDAVIDETGHVVEARAISGPALLLRAALLAVSRWRYQPTYLDGQPVSIRMHVTVKFRLE